MNFSSEHDQLAIGRPARVGICFVVVGNLRELSAFSADDPNVGVTVFLILFAGAILDEGNALSIG